MVTKAQNQALKNSDHIGVYEIKGVIHIGRTHNVYRIWNDHINAMEVLAEYFPSEIATRSDDGHTIVPISDKDKKSFAEGKKAFLDQAEHLSDIEHTNIIRVHNELEFNATAYMIMDEVIGTPLSKLTESSASFSQTELEYILTALLAGLQKVHEQGTFHGDIHPSNIVIKKNGEPVLIDFAAARLAIAYLSDDPEPFLRAAYAPPELYQKSTTPGAASDLYSLGATIYRCISKKEPILATERLSTIEKNESDPHKFALDSAGSEYSDTFLQIILRMLEPDTKKRYQSAAEVLDDLKQNDPDAESIDEAHKPVEGQQLTTSDSDQPRALWLGAAVIIACFLLGLWVFNKDENQAEMRVAETDMATVSTTQQQSVQPGESTIKTNGSATNDVVEVATAIKSTGSAAQQASEESSTIQKPDNQVEALAVMEETSLHSSDQEPSAESTDVAIKNQESSTAVTKSIPVETQVINKTDDKEVLIEQHLAAAEKSLKNFRLTTPPGNNAYQSYQTVLSIDPENNAAANGLALIVEKYVWLIERSIEQNNRKNAWIYLDRAAAILPDSPDVQRLRGVLAETGH